MVTFKKRDKFLITLQHEMFFIHNNYVVNGIPPRIRVNDAIIANTSQRDLPTIWKEISVMPAFWLPVTGS